MESIEERKEELLIVLNQMISLCHPITYAEFNKQLQEIKYGTLEEAERVNDKIGIISMVDIDGANATGISTLSIIATITDILCDKRLAFNIDKETDLILGVQFFDYSKIVAEE